MLAYSVLLVQVGVGVCIWCAVCLRGGLWGLFGFLSGVVCAFGAVGVCLLWRRVRDCGWCDVV